MTETVKAYQDKQQKVLTMLDKLKEFIKQGGEFGLKLSDDFANKLNNAIKDVKEDKLKIALVGGFSEGKTSIAAAWLGKLDKSSMKISASESSNEVSVYDIGDDCLLIDTPGLYGYKEQEHSKTEIEKYKDITKHYVSEAHIILYVMNSKNPIKESHREDLTWLFRDLNLLPRTVFVLSRFDEVADVEDEKSYQQHYKIKRENVTERLKEFLNLSFAESQNLSIVAVSANPFDEGTEYWLANPDEFKKLSHIDTLQSATKQIVQKNGGINDIANEAKKTIFSDIVLKQLPLVEQENTELTHAVSELNSLCELKRLELDGLGSQINSVRNSLKQSLDRYFEDILMQADGTSLETIGEFLIRFVGEQGCLIQSNINMIFQQETASVSTALNQQIIRFNTDLDNVESALGIVAKQGVNHLLTNMRLSNAMVLGARDGIRTTASVIGLDLSKVMKFKPYGAIKLADKLNGIFAVAGLAMEIYDSYKRAEAQKEFERAISQIKSDLGKQQKELLEFIDSDNFIPSLFQGYIDLQDSFEALHKKRIEQEERNQRFQAWKKQGDVIEAEFREL